MRCGVPPLRRHPPGSSPSLVTQEGGATPRSSLQVLGLIALVPFCLLFRQGKTFSVRLWAGENTRPGVSEGLQQGWDSLARVVCRHTSVITPG